MTKIISIANQKGGVGKTTISLQTIYELVDQGYKVLAIDFDGQGNTSSRLAFDVEGGLVGTRTAELYREDELDIKPVICRENLHLIYADCNDAELFEAESLPIEMATNPRSHIQKIKHNYDYIIIDCPPTLGRNLLAALAMSTHVVTVVKVSAFAVDGAVGLMKTFAAIQGSANPNLVNAGFLVNMFDNSPTHWKSFERLKADLGNLIFENVLRYRTPIDTATSEGIPVKSLPYAHVAASELDLVLNEIIERTK